MQMMIWHMQLVSLYFVMELLVLLKLTWSYWGNTIILLGRKVNAAKSYYVTRRQRSSRDTITRSIPCFHKQQLPLMYLGSPFYTGRTSERIIGLVLEKMLSKLDGWEGKLLSLSSKLTLIKSVIQSISFYYFSLIKPPQSIIDNLIYWCLELLL